MKGVDFSVTSELKQEVGKDRLEWGKYALEGPGADCISELISHGVKKACRKRGCQVSGFGLTRQKEALRQQTKEPLCEQKRPRHLLGQKN